MTLCSMITTSIIFNREGEVKDGVALLPITVILTIPTIRVFIQVPRRLAYTLVRIEIVPLPSEG